MSGSDIFDDWCLNKKEVEKYLSITCYTILSVAATGSDQHSSSKLSAEYFICISQGKGKTKDNSRLLWTKWLTKIFTDEIKNQNLIVLSGMFPDILNLMQEVKQEC